jgi:hypothetical protein
MSHCVLTLVPSGCWYDLTEDSAFPIDFEVSEGTWPSQKESTARLRLTEAMAEEMIITLAEALDCLRARPKD